MDNDDNKKISLPFYEGLIKVKGKNKTDALGIFEKYDLSSIFDIFYKNTKTYGDSSFYFRDSPEEKIHIRKFFTSEETYDNPRKAILFTLGIIKKMDTHSSEIESVEKNEPLTKDKNGGSELVGFIFIEGNNLTFSSKTRGVINKSDILSYIDEVLHNQEIKKKLAEGSGYGENKDFICTLTRKVNHKDVDQILKEYNISFIDITEKIENENLELLKLLEKIANSISLFFPKDDYKLGVYIQRIANSGSFDEGLYDLFEACHNYGFLDDQIFLSRGKNYISFKDISNKVYETFKMSLRKDFYEVLETPEQMEITIDFCRDRMQKIESS